ncbi:HAD family hydrolase [Rhizobium leguminosarum]|nr:HAD family hydrolase [Rhizobium laguerreae]MBY5735548.1 HAD family hydrolase [Rhizobium leguminosarum]
MNNHSKDADSFRRIGSAGLVIFERDGTLLRRTSSSGDYTLGDISEEFVAMLRYLRDLNARFGFISDERGMNAGAYGRSEFATLTELLDALLGIRGAMPDFWVAWSDVPNASGTGLQRQADRQQEPGAGAIFQVMERYGIGRKETVFIGSSTAGSLAANDAGVSVIDYFNNRSEGTAQSGAPKHAPNLSSPEATEVQRLRAKIQATLGWSIAGELNRGQQYGSQG